MEETRNFTWRLFCDCYIEAVKDRLYKPELYGEDKQKAAQYALYTVLYRILQLLAPVMPFMTEEIYQLMYSEQKKIQSIHLSPWPAPNTKLINDEAEKNGDLVIAVITEIRREKSEKHLPLNSPIKRLKIYARQKESAKAIMEGKEDISGTCKISHLEIIHSKGEGRQVQPYKDLCFVAEY
jgi:valyl-tRNA synthetase